METIDISQLLRPRNLMHEVDQIIADEMNESHDAAMNGDGRYGAVTFKPTTLDQLLAFADSQEGDGVGCSLQGFLLRKMARILYERGENQQYADILNLHRDIRALLEISRDAESALAWRRAGYQSAIDTARQLGLPARAEAIEDILNLAQKYHTRMDALQKECPCYDLERMKETPFDMADIRAKTGDLMHPQPEPLVEA